MQIYSTSPHVPCKKTCKLIEIEPKLNRGKDLVNNNERWGCPCAEVAMRGGGARALWWGIQQRLALSVCTCAWCGWGCNQLGENVIFCKMMIEKESKVKTITSLLNVFVLIFSQAVSEIHAPIYPYLISEWRRNCLSLWPVQQRNRDSWET